MTIPAAVERAQAATLASQSECRLLLDHLSMLASDLGDALLRIEELERRLERMEELLNSRQS